MMAARERKKVKELLVKEKEIQKKWEAKRMFEPDAPAGVRKQVVAFPLL